VCLGRLLLDDLLEFEPGIVGASPIDGSSESPNPCPRLGLLYTYSVDGKTRWSADASPPLQGLGQACACTPDPRFSSTDIGTEELLTELSNWVILMIVLLAFQGVKDDQ